jgi:hypothetical protein
MPGLGEALTHGVFITDPIESFPANGTGNPLSAWTDHTDEANNDT